MKYSQLSCIEFIYNNSSQLSYFLKNDDLLRAPWGKVKELSQIPLIKISLSMIILSQSNAITGKVMGIEQNSFHHAWLLNPKFQIVFGILHAWLSLREIV